ncbi:TIM-barrel domain-containing protein [Sphingomonas sp. NFR15]|uniref:glycoside hydrolase family 31 protein n=1 Tax=Sphingomonas sp. NFR15 TaxID=1566282 RepID=UPI00087E8534|nr:TIM-barrel domain-containing protein [Sphingomonas sp. NFR15]SDA24598.1 alpha-glucosidase [Sphingomonas sp. NFR15]
MLRYRTVFGIASLAVLSANVAVAAPQRHAGIAAAPVIAAARDGIVVRDGAVLWRVTALTDQILRVRIAPTGTLPEDASWAVPSDVRRHSVAVTPRADGFTTRQLSVRVAGGRLIVADLAGGIISADAIDPVSIAGTAFTLRKELPQSEHIFALGDKTGADLDRRGQTYVDWNTDVAFSSTRDPIYKSIPFFIGAGGPGGSYGMLLDNSYRAFFDFGHVDPDRITMGAPDGPIDYYLIAGPSTAEVVRRYTDLTGRAPLPPRWSFGYQQSRFGYMTADEVRQVAARLRSEHVPTDAMWLDIDFQDRNRPFTVNRQTFPDLAGLTRDLGGEGIKLVAITDLHIAAAPGEGYAPYDSGVAGKHFVRNPDGTTFVGPVWPGPAVFPDFTDKRARDWWGGLYRPFAADGIAGFWNDMNEPAVFDTPTKTMPLDTLHRVASDDFAPRDATHAEIHNIFGMQNTRATFEGLRALRPDERPFVMTRASYAGGQRYAVTWTGDNSSTWDHLRLSVHQLINLGLSGFAYAGADVGGFTGGPSADLLTRWFEIGAFTPIFRDHSDKGKPRTEPWVDGPEHLAIRRRFVEERYRLMPYFYALADANARTGDPIMRPVFYDYPGLLTARSCDQAMTFTVGRSLLVAPPAKMESPQAYDVCLPAGGWFDLWSGRRVTGWPSTDTRDGDATLLMQTPRLDSLPVFVRAGTILPRQPLVQSLSETPAGPLELHVYPGADCTGELYADDGHSMAFTRRGFLRQHLRCAQGPAGLRLSFDARDGAYRPWWRRVAVVVHGWHGGARVTGAGKRIIATADPATETVRFEIADPRGAADFTIAPGA